MNCCYYLFTFTDNGLIKVPIGKVEARNLVLNDNESISTIFSGMWSFHFGRDVYNFSYSNMQM